MYILSLTAMGEGRNQFELITANWIPAYAGTLLTNVESNDNLGVNNLVQSSLKKQKRESLKVQPSCFRAFAVEISKY